MQEQVLAGQAAGGAAMRYLKLVISRPDGTVVFTNEMPIDPELKDSRFGITQEASMQIPFRISIELSAEEQT